MAFVAGESIRELFVSPSVRSHKKLYSKYLEAGKTI